ncbi:MAG: SPFH domain-containing protein [bacterium]|nr:SPFH domain-containing protein [bacterium]
MNTVVKDILSKVEQAPRMAVALISWVLLLVLSVVLTAWLGVRLQFGLALWAFVMSFSVRPFMVSVPEYTALVTINLLREDIDALREYRTGLHFRYPWEQVKIGNYINLRLLPLGKTEDYPSKDGPKMHATWQAPYKVVDAIKYIGVGRESVEDILTKAGSGVLSAYIARHNAEDAKEKQEDAEKILQQKFTEMKLEEICGVHIPVVSLADLDYEESVQKVRATQYIARKVKEIAKELQGKGRGRISDGESLNDAMILHKDVTKHINQVEGKGGEALAALLMGMAQGGSGPKEGDKKK